MPEICSCGAKLPPDALFCHKCGKPQREITSDDQIYSDEPPVAPPPIPVVQLQLVPPVDFRNPIAVRIALMAAALSSALIWLPFVNFAIAGFGASYFYRRRTGFPVDVAAGVRLGWITGVLMFAISTVFLGISIATDSGFSQKLQTQVKAMGAPGDPAVQQAVAFVQSPAGLATALVMALIFAFACITGLSMAGGALAAVFSNRRTDSSV
jgi:hypothetical protein